MRSRSSDLCWFAICQGSVSDLSSAGSVLSGSGSVREGFDSAGLGFGFFSSRGAVLEVFLWFVLELHFLRWDPTQIHWGLLLHQRLVLCNQAGDPTSRKQNVSFTDVVDPKRKTLTIRDHLEFVSTERGQGEDLHSFEHYIRGCQPMHIERQLGLGPHHSRPRYDPYQRSWLWLDGKLHRFQRV